MIMLIRNKNILRWFLLLGLAGFVLVNNFYGLFNSQVSLRMPYYTGIGYPKSLWLYVLEIIFLILLILLILINRTFTKGFNILYLIYSLTIVMLCVSERIVSGYFLVWDLGLLMYVLGFVAYWTYYIPPLVQVFAKNKNTTWFKSF